MKLIALLLTFDANSNAYILPSFYWGCCLQKENKINIIKKNAMNAKIFGNKTRYMYKTFIEVAFSNYEQVSPFDEKF